MEENGQHKKTRKKEKRLSFWYILGGGVLKEDFILRHTRMIVLLVGWRFSLSVTGILVCKSCVRSTGCNSN